VTPQFGATSTVANSVPYTSDFPALRQDLIDAGLFNAIPAASLTASTALSTQRTVLGCDGPDPQTGCDVLVGFDVQVLRNTQPVVAFAQLLFGYELSAGPELGRMNLVQPEEGPLSLRGYTCRCRYLRAPARQNLASCRRTGPRPRASR
jgi:hypothetical protein